MEFNGIKTERLTLRAFTEADFGALCAILCDKETMYAYEGAFDIVGARDWLNNQYRRYKNDGFGLWAVVLRETGEMIGQCGLTYQKYRERDVVEIGYLFNKGYWHCGYATEAAVACKDYAFNVLNERVVYSIIRDTNVASQKVALRNGMTKIDSITKLYRGVIMPHYVFCINNLKETLLS